MSPNTNVDHGSHHHGPASPKTNHIQIEILLLWILLADLVNGIVTEILRLKKMEEKLKWVSIWFGIGGPLSVYLIVGMISLTYGYIHVTRQCSKEKCSFSSCSCSCQDKQCECCILKFNWVYPQCHGSEWINILAKIFTIIGGVLYFLGDNFSKVYEGKNAGALTLGFSVFGVLLYRIIPTALKKLERYFKDMPSTRKDKGFNLCSPNNNETHSLIVAYTYLLTIVIDFDVWLTVVLKKADNTCDNMNSLCDRKDEINVLWSLYGGMLLSFIVIEAIIMVIFLIGYCHPSFQKNSCKLNLIPPKQKGCCKGSIAIIIELLLSCLVFIAVGMFLIADNQHLLDCYFIKAKVGEDESQLRLGFFICAFFIFTIINFGFFFRRTCCCVQRVKRELVCVNVLSNDKLQVYVREKKEIHSFNYQIESSEITESDCYHEEMYKNDIERIAKCLGNIYKLNITKMNIQEAMQINQVSGHPLLYYYTESDIRRIVKCLGNEGKLVAVNIRDDQIAVVREVEEKLYLVLHDTQHKPATTEVYKVCKENDIPSQSNDTSQSKLTAMYYHDQGTYYDNEQPIRCIFLQNYEGTEYAVLKEIKINASPFVNVKFISWNIWTEKDIVEVRVQRDPDTRYTTTYYYDETENCFVTVEKKPVKCVRQSPCFRSRNREQPYTVLDNDIDVKEKVV